MEDLNFLKYYPAEWNNGAIYLQPLHLQGLFINLVNQYWIRGGTVDLDDLKRRIPEATDEDFKILIKKGIIKVRNGELHISFLARQIEQRAKKSIKNSLNGKKGGHPKGLKNKPKETQHKPKQKPKETQTKGNENLTPERGLDKGGEFAASNGYNNSTAFRALWAHAVSKYALNAADEQLNAKCLEQFRIICERPNYEVFMFKLKSGVWDKAMREDPIAALQLMLDQDYLVMHPELAPEENYTDDNEPEELP